MCLSPSSIPTFEKHVEEEMYKWWLKKSKWEVLFSAIQTPSVNTARTNPGSAQHPHTSMKKFNTLLFSNHLETISFSG